MSNLVAAISVFACLILRQPGSAQMLYENCGMLAAGPRIIDALSPWMAYLHTSPDFRCGGTLINDRFVLTAAHCIHRAEVLTVRLGEYNRMQTINDCVEGGAEEDYNPPAEEYEVDMAFRDRLYIAGEHPNDIGLLRLARRVQFKKHIQPISLFKDPAMAAAVAEKLSWYTGTGWGKLRSGNTSPILQTINLTRYNRSVCRKTFGILLETDQLCAGQPTGNLCNGYSGGPLFRSLEYQGVERFVQFGIASFTTRDCVGPIVYPDVASHAEWIARVLKQYDADAPAARIASQKSKVQNFQTEKIRGNGTQHSE